MTDLRPQDHLDCAIEQQEFLNLVKCQSSARILTISDAGGRGKSSLLKRFRHNCEFEIRPSVPCCLLDLDKLRDRDPSPFAFAASVAREFAARGGDIQQLFTRFNHLNNARIAKDFVPFADNGRVPHPGNPGGMGIADISTMSGGKAIGFMYQSDVKANTAYVQAPGAPVFTDEQEQRARDRCIEALFDDLRDICERQPMVLLLDSWERCNSDLRDWIFREVFGNNVLHADAARRPDKLVVVVAGRPRVPGKTPDGLRSDEFRNLFDTDEDYSATVRSINSLNRDWDSEIVRRFMEDNGLPELIETDISMIRERVRRGNPLPMLADIVGMLGNQLSSAASMETP